MRNPPGATRPIDIVGQARSSKRSCGKGPGRWWVRLFLLAVPTALLAVFFVLLQHQPDFYTERFESIDTEKRKLLSKRCLKKGLDLSSDIQNRRQWEGQFEETLINAWLAEDFRENHAEQSLPPSVSEPRVAMEDDRLQVGFRFTKGPLSIVVRIEVQVWVPKPNLLAVQLDGAWAGAIPLPASYTRQMFEQIADAYRLHVSWKRHGSRLVALLEFPRGHRSAVLERVEIQKGRLRILGVSGRLLPESDFAPSAN